MEQIKQWILRNLSNLFGLLGVVATIYFGVFYVPSWISESQNERLNNAQREVVQSIKELVFSDSIVTIEEIQSLVVAKEVDRKVTIPFSFYGILTLTEESFMEDKFLPLEKRRALIKEIHTLKTKVPITIENKEEKQESKAWFSKFNLLSILSVLLTLLATVFGLLSSVFKYRQQKEQQEEISNEISQTQNELENREQIIKTEQDYIDALREFKGLDILPPTNYDQGYDALIIGNDKKVFIEFKLLTKSKVGLSSIRRFSEYIKGRDGIGIFIYNTDLTGMVQKEVEELSRDNKSIFVLKITNKQELISKLKEILHTTGVWQNGG